MSDLRRSVSPLQLDLLLLYLEQRPPLALASPRSRHDQIQARRLWEKLARTLNKVDGKVVKNGKGWSRYWADLKCKTRRKYTSLKKCNSSLHSFTQWERRIIKLLTDEHGNLLPNAHQLADKEYQCITKPSTKKKIKRSNSDDVQEINQDTNTQTYEHTDEIYIINHVELTNDHKTVINIENNDKNLKVRSDREMYSSDEQVNCMEDQYNGTVELNSNTGIQNNTKVRHKYSTSEHNNSNAEHMYRTAEHNNSKEEYNNGTGEPIYITTEHTNTKVEHNNMYSTSEHNTSTAESRTKKTIEELKEEILEFQLKRQKELFEREKKERNERHSLEMEILRLKRDILVKELNNLT